MGLREREKGTKYRIRKVRFDQPASSRQPFAASGFCEGVYSVPDQTDRLQQPRNKMDKGGSAGSLVSNRCNRCNRCNHLLQLLHSLTSKREQEAGSDEELTASICKVIQSLIGGLRQGISTRESIFERLIRSPPATLDHPTTANHFQPHSNPGHSGTRSLLSAALGMPGA